MGDGLYRKANEHNVITPLGGTNQLLEAQADLRCGGCGELIPVGAHFTRHKTPNANRGQSAFCQVCYPFRYIRHFDTDYKNASADPISPKEK